MLTTIGRKKEDHTDCDEVMLRTMIVTIIMMMTLKRRLMVMIAIMKTMVMILSSTLCYGRGILLNPPLASVTIYRSYYGIRGP